jgi:two-component system, chemotaxis family, chemotaxis protein CheY
VPSVLIVDDSPTIRGFARIYLKPLNVEVQEAEEGMQALELVRAQPPAVAIVDINMPGMDGLQFIRELRSDSRPELRNLPVILLTGDRSEQIREQGRNAGAADFLGKPIKGAELQAMVKKFLPGSSP